MKKQSVFLVTGKPSLEQLQIYRGQDHNGMTNAVLVRESFERNVKAVYPDASVFFEHSNIYRLQDVMPRSTAADQLWLQLIESKYLVDLLLVSERMVPQQTGANSAISYCYEAFRVACAILHQVSPDVVIFPNVPHGPVAFAIYVACRLKGITLSLSNTARADFPYIVFNTTDITELPWASDDDSCQTPLSDISLQQVEKLQELRVPSYMLNQGFLGTVKSDGTLNTKIKRKNDYNNIFQKLKANCVLFLRADLKKSFQRLEARIDLTSAKPYIFFALHYQPEMTTMPLAGFFASQYIILRMLADGLPPQVNVVIKEHPSMRILNRNDYHHYRSYALLHLIRKQANFYLVPAEVSSGAIIINALAVATSTGTVGLEALASRKPILSFGYGNVRHTPGVYECWSVGDVATAINTITSKQEDVPEDAVVRLLAKMEKNAVSVPVEWANKSTAGDSEARKTCRWFGAAATIKKLNEEH